MSSIKGSLTIAQEEDIVFGKTLGVYVHQRLVDEVQYIIIFCNYIGSQLGMQLHYYTVYTAEDDSIFFLCLVMLGRNI